MTPKLRWLSIPEQKGKRIKQKKIENVSKDWKDAPAEYVQTHNLNPSSDLTNAAATSSSNPVPAQENSARKWLVIAH
jgi:hypothetical protein